MNPITDAVMQYVNSPSTDYAIMINGPWGCGKTHYWKQTIEPALKKPEPGSNKRQPFYCSFYGCHSIREVAIQLLFSYLDGGRNNFATRHRREALEWARGLYGLGRQWLAKQLPFTLPEIDPALLIRTDNAVLCFDDLERSHISIAESLGFINTFVEHRGAKAVILCHEEKINNADYTKIKEKLIGSTLDFHIDTDLVIDSLIMDQRDKENFHQFLSKHKDLLTSLFAHSEAKNIRSLRRAINSLWVVTNCLSESRVDFDRFTQHIVHATAMAAFELFGRSADPEHVRRVFSLEHLWAVRMIVRDAKEGEELTPLEEYQSSFSQRYFDEERALDWTTAVGCEPICNYLITGILDREGLVEWIRKLANREDANRESLYQITNGPLELEDGAFSAATAALIHEARSGQLSNLRRTIEMFEPLVHLANDGLISTTPDDLYSIFQSGLDVARREGRIAYSPRFRDDMSHSALRPRSALGAKLLDELFKLNDELMEAEIRRVITQKWTDRAKDLAPLLELFRGHSELDYATHRAFAYLDPTEVATWVVQAPNSVKWQFWGAVGRRQQERRYNDKDLDAERPNLVALTKLLKERIVIPAPEGTPPPVSSFLIDGIAKFFDQLLSPKTK